VAMKYVKGEIEDKLMKILQTERNSEAINKR
jgi:hypothetical protein